MQQQYDLFQFLMVQLKVKRKNSARHMILISIPYGSIKSFLDIIYKVMNNKFQFLMVQLKDYP